MLVLIEDVSACRTMTYGNKFNLLSLAGNTRNSVEKMDRFYAKPLSGEMTIDMLQSRRRPRKI